MANDKIKQDGKNPGIQESLSSTDTAVSPARMPRWAWLGCVLLVIVASLHSATSPIGGGDTWVAMACGRYSLGNWCVDQPGRTWQMRLLDKLGVHITMQDPFSPKSKPNGWVNQNWLTHAIFYKMQQAWGFNSIVIYKFIQAVLTGLFAWWAARALGVHPVLAGAMVAFGILLSRSYIDLRPNISSILFSIMMIFILARWQQGRYKSIFWLIPLMILWSNVHGGFVYAIMIMLIMAAGHLVNKILAGLWGHRFFAVSWRGYFFLLAGLLLVIVIPAVFSPFGLENLIHPLIIIVSKAGKEWREVAEWKAIYEKGFGNVGPYFWFIGILAVTFIVWWILYLLKPRSPQPRGRRHRLMAESVPWPAIDLARIGVIAITLFMSIQSRRFVFLGGVILAPFLARMMQEIVEMIGMMRLHRRQPGTLVMVPFFPRRFGWPLAGGTVAAAVIIAIVAVHFMWNNYYREERRKTDIFWYMVGIVDQPVGAMEVFNKLQIRGLVLGGWTNGGYICYGQTPDPQTGRPPCQVFMDGRAQAAYSLEHYQTWGKIQAAAGYIDAKKFDQILQQEGINVALLRQSSSSRLIKALEDSKNWLIVANIPTPRQNKDFDVILLRKDDPMHKDVFARIIQMNAEKKKENP